MGNRILLLRKTVGFSSALALAWCLATPSPASACSCAPPPDAASALAEARAVFSGQVVGQRDGPDAYSVRYRFAVVHAWKGLAKKDREVEVTTARSGAACGVRFEDGGGYLVYASGEDSLRTNLCTRTKAIEAAGEEMRELDALAPRSDDAATEPPIPIEPPSTDGRRWRITRGAVVVGIVLLLTFVTWFVARPRGA